MTPDLGIKDLVEQFKKERRKACLTKTATYDRHRGVGRPGVSEPLVSEPLRKI